jgi:hypothetical protein
MQALYDGAKRFSMIGFAAFLAVSTLDIAAGLARPLTPAETRESPYDGQIPLCGDPAVFERIQSKFSQAENEYWHSGLEIQAFDKVGEIGYRTEGTDYIPRRYCVAEAVMNDLKLRPVTYEIVQDMGIIGFWGFGVEWCVAGLDREKSYSPNCKMARP